MTPSAQSARPELPGAGARRLWPRVALILVLGLAFLPQWLDLAHLWQSEMVYSHGWLIAGVCAWLCLGGTGDNPPARTRSRLAWLPLAGLLPFFVLVQFARLDLAQQAMLPVLGLAFVYGVYGTPGVRRALFPAGYFLLAIPLWDALIPALQWLTVHANALALAALGIPASIQGDFVTVPAGVFEIADGCAGSHFFVVALAVSSLEAYLARGGKARTLTSLGLALTLSLVANWLRVLIIILRGNATHMQTSLIRDHYWFGWFLFAGALGVYFLLLRAFDQRHPLKPLPAPEPAPSPGPGPSWPVLLPGVLLLALVGVNGLVRHLAWQATDVRLAADPVLTAPFRGPVLQDLDWRPSFAGAAAESLATYRSEAGPVSYYRAVYGEQHSGAKLVGYGNRVLPRDWVVQSDTLEPGSKTSDYTPFPGPARVLVARAPDGGRWLLWTWYVVDGQRIARPRDARLRQGLQGFGRLTPVPSQVGILATPCGANCTDAALRLHHISEQLGRGESL